jgi:23S rRNA C2498 (ribose-2'-O)-methylase RlmM
MKPTSKNTHIYVCRPGYASVLARELDVSFNIKSDVIHPAAIEVDAVSNLPHASKTVFARQALPHVFALSSVDINECADEVVSHLLKFPKLHQYRSWTIHGFASDDDAALKLAGKTASRVKHLIHSKHQDLQKRLVDSEKFAEDGRFHVSTDAFVVQIWASGIERVYASLAPAKDVLPFVGGVRRLKTLYGAPSRSSSKLLEAIAVLGCEPQSGESGVDLGASPGGWTYVMAVLGVHMTAVDHAELRLPKSKKTDGQVTHLKENGLKYMPERAVDWLCCDMVMGAKDTLAVLELWISKAMMNNFVVNVKLPQADPWPSVSLVLDLVAKYQKDPAWKIFKAKHLFHDRNEITLMGSKQDQAY